MRSLHRLAGLSIALSLPACGSSTPTPLPTPTPCTQTPLLQVNGPVPSRGLGRVALPVASSGRLDITIDWTFATSPIAAYVVAAGSCPIESFNASACTFLARSETTAKPRKFSVNVSAGNYELLVVNFAAVDESISAQIVLSSSTCPALAVAAKEATLSAARGPLTETPLR